MLKILQSARKSRGAMLLLIAAVVALCGVTGGTIAYVMARSETVENLFTMDGIAIDLTETDTEDGDGDAATNRYSMVPGAVIGKDPVVTVKANSMACWLFVKMDLSENFGDYLAYTVGDGWLAVEGQENVYYRLVDASQEDQSFSVLAEDQVRVKDDVTVTMLRQLTDADYPTMTFTAYAVQQSGVETPAEAWPLAAGLEQAP